MQNKVRHPSPDTPPVQRWNGESDDGLPLLGEQNDVTSAFFTRPQVLDFLDICRRSLKTLEKYDSTFPKLRQIVGSRVGYLRTEMYAWAQTRPLAIQPVATPEMRSHMSELARARAAKRRKHGSKNRRCIRAKSAGRDPN